jgi:hypothetical protein
MESNKKVREFVKISVQDIEIAMEFFDNEKHFNEWLINVFNYYLGKNIQIKTKIVQKYFNTYKKTMDYILIQSELGKKGAEEKTKNQEVKEDTLEGGVNGSLKVGEDTPTGKGKGKGKVNNKGKEIIIPTIQEFLDYSKIELKDEYQFYEFSLKAKYESWIENKWKDGNGNKIVNWKTKIKNTIPFLSKMYPSNQTQKSTEKKVVYKRD